MKIAIASDFSGFPLKEVLANHLTDLDHEVIDLGQFNEEEVFLYPQAATLIANAIQDEVCEKAIVICGTGAGVSIVANKFKGVYCVACESVYTAESISIINDANVLALGNNVIGHKNALKIVDAYLSTEFALGFSKERTNFLKNMLDDVRDIEGVNFK